MVSAPSSQAHHQLRVPRTDGSLLVEPAWHELPEVLAGNSEKLHQADNTFFGKSELVLRQESRKSMLRAARQYLAGLGLESAFTEISGPVMMSGHQPTLFHPGVWVKNFAIGELARKTQGTAVNLIIDNDTATNTSFRVPARTGTVFQSRSIALDRATVAQPWEELAIQDSRLFQTFATRVGEALSPWNLTPALESVWEEATNRTRQANNVSQTLTAARLLFEHQNGIRNLELPISLLAEEEPFRWFSLHLLAHLKRFREVYNTHLALYRRRNKVRNEQHPVPDLQVDGEWEEAPFWLWRAGEKQRHHAWVCRKDNLVILSDGVEQLCEFSLPENGPPDEGLRQLAGLAERGIRFRPRALTTTLYARLFLCNLFVHGIGGAKYDEVTTDLLREFYHKDPPRYLTLSGTIHLPTGVRINITREEIAGVKQQLRNLKYHSGHSLSSARRARYLALFEERQRLLEEQAVFKNLSKTEKQACASRSRARFQRFKKLALEFAELTQPEQKKLAAELSRLQSLWDQKLVLENREYPALFYPASRLHTFIAQLRHEIDPVFC